MNHEQVESENTAERYSLGRLSAEEEVLFEEHLVECSSCQEAVEASDRLRDALRIAAAQDATGLPAARASRTGRSAWLRRWPYAAAVAGLVALPAGFLWVQLETVRRERDALRQEATSAEALQTEQAAALDHERVARADAEARLAGSQSAARVFTLPFTRGATTSSADALSLRLPAPPQWIVLALERDEASPESTYRVSLLAEDDRVLWQSRDSRATSRDLVAVSLHSSLLHPGAYVVRLEELDSRNRLVAVAHYPFRAVAP